VHVPRTFTKVDPYLPLPSSVAVIRRVASSGLITVRGPNCVRQVHTFRCLHFLARKINRPTLSIDIRQPSVNGAGIPLFASQDPLIPSRYFSSGDSVATPFGLPQVEVEGIVSSSSERGPERQSGGSGRARGKHGSTRYVQHRRRGTEERLGVMLKPAPSFFRVVKSEKSFVGPRVSPSSV